MSAPRPRPAAPHGAAPSVAAAADVVPSAETLRARRLMLGLFVLLGVTVSSWLARLPTVRDALDLGTAELGTILLVGAMGSLATVLVAGPVVARLGTARTMVVAAGLFAAASVLLGLGPTVGSVVVLTAGVFAMSVSFALGNVPLNVETAVIERAMGRTVVPQFHAAFSVGSVIGSLLGAAASWAQVPVLVQFTVVGLGALLWRLLAIPGAVLPSAPEPVAAAGAQDAAPRRRGAGMRASLAAWREPRTLLIGLLVMTGALSEGSANNWLAIAVVDGFAQTEAVAAVVFGVFVGSMTVSRLAGSWLLDRFGRVVILTASGAFAFVGILVFGTAPGLPLAIAAVVAWGLGAGLVIPIGMAAAANDPLRAAGRIAVVSAFASVSALAAPPLLGMAAEVWGARQALMLIAVFMLLTIGLAAVTQDRPAAQPRSGPAPSPAHGARARPAVRVVRPAQAGRTRPERRKASAAAVKVPAREPVG